MGTKLPSSLVNNEREKKLSVPPGFESLTSLTFKKIVYNNEEAADFKADGKDVESGSGDSPICKYFLEKFKSSSNQNPGNLHDHIAPRIRDSEPSKISTVSARWPPKASCLPVLDDAPVFHPSEEEFKDTLKYITKIRPEALEYGICRIVPPPSWKPSCTLRDTEAWETSTFSTCVQHIHRLRSLYLKGKVSGSNEMPEKKRQKALATKCQKSGKESQISPQEPNCFGMTSDFGYGRESTLPSFKKYADSFMKEYFSLDDDVSDPEVKSTSSHTQKGPLIARIEGEYWRIIENPSKEIEVSRGSNLDAKTFGSGFPTKVSREGKAGYTKYMDLGWNLNNTPKLVGSLLPFGCDSTSAILAPRLFIGMCFASQCWRVEDHDLYSLCYMHFGEPKVWYGVPGRYCSKFMEVVKKLFPQLSKHPALLRDLAFQISPSMLMSAGIPVYRCVQNPMDFILIFPGAYHSGFDCGFNCSEAARFAPLDWLPYGMNAAEMNSHFCRKNTLFYDRLLFGAAIEAIRATWKTFTTRIETSNSKMWKSVCGEEGILTKVIKSRVGVEKIRREHICNPSQSSVFEEDEAANVRECSICLSDLYLSAVACSCSPKLYTCLRHVKRTCSCPWSDRHFIFRYEAKDLDSLISALEGNLKATHFWAKKLIRPIVDDTIRVDKSCLLAASKEKSKTTCKSSKQVSVRPSSVPHSIASGSRILPPPSTGNNDIVLGDRDGEG